MAFTGLVTANSIRWLSTSALKFGRNVKVDPNPFAASQLDVHLVVAFAVRKTAVNKQPRSPHHTLDFIDQGIAH